MRTRPLALALLLGGCAGDVGGDLGPGPYHLSENLLDPLPLSGGQASPDGWSFLADDGVIAKGAWSSEDGTPYLQTEISPGSGPGHARWLFDRVPLEGGAFYEYSDEYRSFGTGRLLWSCETAEGTRYYSASQSSTSRSWTEQRFRFYVSEDCLGMVLHLLDSPGVLDTRRHSLREIAAAPLSQAMVSISFDDGHESNLSIGALELERRGWRGSFYLAPELLEGEGYLSWAQAEGLAAKGHEIGAHSSTHRSLVEVPADELRDEVLGSLLQLEAIGARGGFAYPYGEFNEVIEPYVAANARYVRSSLHGLNDRRLDPARLKVIPVTSETTSAELTRSLDDAVATSSWIIFLFHDLGAVDSSDEYRTDAAQFVELLDSLAERQLRVLPVLEALESIGH